ALRAKHHRQSGIRVELQLVLHRRRKPIMSAPEVDRPRRDHDRHVLAGDDHRCDLSAVTISAMRAAVASVGRRITTLPATISTGCPIPFSIIASGPLSCSGTKAAASTPQSSG